MNIKIFWIIAIIIILISIGVYFMLNQQRLLQSQIITNFEECVRAGYQVGESYPRQCWTSEGEHFIEEIEKNLPVSETITVSGEITCLPKIGKDVQTLECAIGLKGKDGRYYGLKNLFKFDQEYKFSVGGLRVEISGVFSPKEIKGPDGNKYNVIGIIDVTSIKEIID